MYAADYFGEIDFAIHGLYVDRTACAVHFDAAIRGFAFHIARGRGDRNTSVGCFEVQTHALGHCDCIAYAYIPKWHPLVVGA